MDLNKSLRLAIETGKVCMGSNEAQKAINAGSAKLIICLILSKTILLFQVIE